MNVKVRSILKLPGYGVFVSAAVLGVSKAVVFEGHALEFTMPDRTDAFQPDGKAFAPMWETDGPDSDDVAARLVEQVRVDIAYDIDLDLEALVASANAPDLGPRPGGAEDELRRICIEGHKIAERFVTAFCARVRTTLHQDWLGTSSDAPTFVTTTDVVDVASGHELPFHSIKFRSYADIIGDHTKLTLEGLDRIADDVVAGRTPALARELIYDALYLGRVREPPDLRLAVLCVAIGVEAETVTTLRDLCAEPARALLDHVLASPRDFTIAMAMHLDKTMNAVCGRSLRSDNGPLYAGAVGLFRVRNAIAHGKSPAPGPEDMLQALKDGVEIYRWLKIVSADAREAADRGRASDTPPT